MYSMYTCIRACVGSCDNSGSHFYVKCKLDKEIQQQQSKKKPNKEKIKHLFVHGPLCIIRKKEKQWTVIYSNVLTEKFQIDISKLWSEIT